MKATAQADVQAMSSAAWAMAQRVVHLLQLDACAMGGVWLRAGHGPVRQSWLNALAQASLPQVKLPLTIDTMGLQGGIDLGASLHHGRLCWQGGALERADGGLVILPMAERAPRGLCAQLGQCLDQRRLSARDPGSERPVHLGVVALDESDDDEPGLEASLADRLAMWLDLRPLSLRDAPDFNPLSPQAAQQAQDRWAQLRTDPQRTDSDRIHRLTLASLELGVDSARAAWLALQVAQGHAALEGRDQLTDEDEQFAVITVLLPRAKRLPLPSTPPEAEQGPDVPPDDPGPCEAPPSCAPQEASGHAPDDAPADAGDDLQVESALAQLPADLLAQCLAAGWGARAKGAMASGQGQRSRALGSSGRPLPVRPGRPQGALRLDLPASLRHAIARQRLRASETAPTGRLAWRLEDLHVKRRQPSERCCVILAVDASGSTALQRLAQAKGAVELLLAQSYVRRDSVCVIGFRGRSAECLLPATRSLVRAKRVLAAMPGGGGTPIASALQLSLIQAQLLRRQGLTPLLIVLSDGRGNVNLEGIGGRAQAHSDALNLAQQVQLAGLASIWVDTAPQPEPLAQALSQAMDARYLPMPQVRAQHLAQVMHTAMSEARTAAVA